MKTPAGNANHVCLRLHDVKLSLLVLLTLIYILMIWESGTSGHSGLFHFFPFGKICLLKNLPGVMMQAADGRNETFLLMFYTSALERLWKRTRNSQQNEMVKLPSTPFII